METEITLLGSRLILISASSIDFGNLNLNLTCSILAVEIDSNLCEIAKFNLDSNNVENVHLFRDDSKNFCRTWKSKQHSFPNVYQTILVDPPRGGLDKTTLQLLSQFQNVIYISCNPLESFYKEYENSISQTHQILKMALFDQFPYTKHIECGFFLRKYET